MYGPTTPTCTPSPTVTATTRAVATELADGARGLTGTAAVQADVADWRVVALLVAAALVLLPAVASAAPSGQAPVVAGKVVAPGVFGVPYADVSTVAFPSTPPIGPTPIQDGDMIYDTQVSVEIVDALPSAISLPVSVEIWTTGTVTVYEPRGSGNNTTVVPETVPARLDPTWSNATISALGDSSGTVSVTLADVSTEHPMEISVGSASWSVGYLTAATSVVSQVYTGSGLWGFIVAFSVETFVAVGISLVVARRLAERVHSVPRVRPIWPLLWIGVPVVGFALLYVPVNQAIAGLSPFVAPIPVAIAALPYFARTFSRRHMARLHGLEMRSLGDVRSSEAVVDVVDSEQGLRCAPRTWAEVVWTLLGVPLPEVQGEEVDVLGHSARVPPSGMTVSRLLPGTEYRPDADREYWVDATRPVSLQHHRLRWTREEQVERTISGPDGQTRTESRAKRRISPHIERGYLRAKFPPTQPVLKVLSGVRQAEDLAHENETLHLAVAEMRGTIWSRIRSGRLRSVAAMEASYRSHGEPRTEDELRRLVDRGARSGGKGANGASEAEKGPGNQT